MVFRVERKERVKEIPGYGGKYLVGDLGRVYSGGCELSLVYGRYVNLSRRGVAERVDVAYLVARAFLPNLEGRPYVVHLDGDFSNNRVENLAWSEKRAPRRERRGCGAGAVVQYDRDGHFVARYDSVREAGKRTGIAARLIRLCADGKNRTSMGWIWKYE